MTKFNKGVVPYKESPLHTTDVVGHTYEGATALAKNSKTELFLHAVGSFFGEDTFYEDGSFRENTLQELSFQIAVEDVEWLTDFVFWLRREGNMRSAPVAIALDGVRSRLAAKKYGLNRRLIRAAFSRPDDPSEAVAYWVQNYGKNLPMPLKRAVADFLKGLNSYGYMKYGRKGDFKHRDLIRLTHPKPGDETKSAFFRYILEKEDAPPPRDIELRETLLKLPVEERKTVTADTLQAAGFTWEQYAGWLQGEIDWNKIIPSMGYMALLRNLRNFEEAGIKSDYVRDKIADANEVKRSRQFPFRFVSAYNELQGFYYLEALDSALDHSLLNIPSLQGNTVVLVDQSDSMTWHLSKHSKMDFRMTAALFGSAIAKRAERAHLWQFGSHPVQIKDFRKPVLRLVNEDFRDLGGTNTPMAIIEAARAMPEADRLIIITDEQAHFSTQLPTKIPVYIWNLVGYKMGHGSSRNVHHIGGLTDNSFRIIQLLEAGKNSDWPWLVDKN